MIAYRTFAVLRGIAAIAVVLGFNAVAFAQVCDTVPASGGAGTKCKSERAVCSPPTDGSTSDAGKCKTTREISDYVCDCVGNPPPQGAFQIQAGPPVPTSVEVGMPSSAVSAISVLSVPGRLFAGTVTLSCQSLGTSAPEPTCTVNPATLTLGSAGITPSSTLSIQISAGTPAGIHTIQVNGVSDAGAGPYTGPSNVPLLVGSTRGFIDLHTHPMSNLGFGGKLLYGGVDADPNGGALLPSDPNCNLYVNATTIQQALGHDKSTHGGWNLVDNPCGDDIRAKVIDAFQSATPGAASIGPDAFGYPSFAEWPVWNDITHQKMWVDWIQRAFDSGLRVMVALSVNNRTLADIVTGPGDILPTDDKFSSILQITEMKAFVARHNFMEIAYTSSDVTRIVRSNKLAIVLGIEIDNIGDLMQQPLVHGVPNPYVPTEAQVTDEINQLYASGVRYIFPVHLIDNLFGGTAAYESEFNYSNFFEFGSFWQLRCADAADGIGFRFANQSTDAYQVEVVKLGFAPLPDPSYPNCAPDGSPPGGLRNSRPLTGLGQFAVKEMMKHGMLIDVDHGDQDTVDELLALGVTQSYPMNSGHNGVRAPSGSGNERSLTAAQYFKIGGLHGLVGVGDAGKDAYDWVKLYNATLAATQLTSVFAGFGTDTDGFALGMPPSTRYSRTTNPGYLGCYSKAVSASCSGDQTRSAYLACLQNAANTCLGQFPDVVSCGATCGRPKVTYDASLQMSTLGDKTWNYNLVGVAHYGMIADFLRDVRNVPAEPNSMSGADLIDSNLMKGTSYFIDTWHLAEIRAPLIN